MTEIIIYTSAALVFLVGLSEIINRLICKLFSVTARRPLLLMPLRGQDAEIALRSLLAQEHGAEAGRYAAVIAVDCGVDRQAAECCRRLCGENAGLTVCTIDELGEVLNLF